MLQLVLVSLVLLVVLLLVQLLLLKLLLVVMRSGHDLSPLTVWPCLCKSQGRFHSLHVVLLVLLQVSVVTVATTQEVLQVRPNNILSLTRWTRRRRQW